MSGPRRRILLVEDNEDHAELVRRNLADNEETDRLDHVVDGAEALDYLHGRGQYAGDRRKPLPDVILLDLRLPKIDGLEVLRQIKESERLRRIPVIILTTSEADRDLAMAYDYHANSYLVKPLDFTVFRSMMQQIGHYWTIWNHPAPEHAS